MIESDKEVVIKIIELLRFSQDTEDIIREVGKVICLDCGLEDCSGWCNYSSPNYPE